MEGVAGLWLNPDPRWAEIPYQTYCRGVDPPVEWNLDRSPYDPAMSAVPRAVRALLVLIVSKNCSGLWQNACPRWGLGLASVLTHLVAWRL